MDLSQSKSFADPVNSRAEMTRGWDIHVAVQLNGRQHSELTLNTESGRLER